MRCYKIAIAYDPARVYAVPGVEYEGDYALVEVCEDG